MESTDITYLHQLIERYFEAATSVEEERELRRLIAPLEDTDDEAIREARAVMGFIAVMPKRAKRRTLLIRITGIAAAMAVVAVVGYKLNDASGPSSDCYAYVAGEQITDKEQVEANIIADLQAISDAQSQINEEISDDFTLLREAMQFSE